jgi:anti-anti-sigma factor
VEDEKSSRPPADDLRELNALRAEWARGRKERQPLPGRGPACEVEQLGADAYAVHPPAVIDAFTAPELSELLLGLIADGARRVVVDLSGASLIDSSGLGALLSAHLQLREDGGRLELVPGGREVMRGFELTGLARVFATI